ncbi:hypothetical protein D9M68_820490 [compost metagenome]
MPNNRHERDVAQDQREDGDGRYAVSGAFGVFVEQDLQLVHDWLQRQVDQESLVFLPAVDQIALQQFQVVRIGLQVFEHHVDKVAQTLFGTEIGLKLIHQRLGMRAVHLRFHGLEQLFLVTKVVIDRRQGDIRLGRDIAHADAVEAVLGEQLGRDFENPLARAGRLGGAVFHD